MTYRVINATTITLAGLLNTYFENDPLLSPFFDSGMGGNMVLSARTPREMSDAGEAGLSVWLYQVARDPELHNLPRHRASDDTYEHQPLPLRLHYLITPVVNDQDTSGNNPGLEQFIIGKVLQTLHDNAHIYGSLLRGDLAGTDSKLTVRLEPLGLEEITRIWDAMESSYQLCVSYEVSMVMLASDKEIERIVPVESVEPEYGLITGVGG